MLRSLRVGRFFGIDVFIHWTFWALPLLHIYQSSSYTARTAGFSVAFTFTVFFCVLLHEFGHALTARFFGIGTRDIYLTPLGGIARLERITEKPIEEILITLAGPAVNVVIFLLLLPALIMLPPQADSDPIRITSLRQLMAAVCLTNLALAVFNLLPAFPMDGGRLLRAFLAFFTSRLTATRIAVYVGMGTAALMAVGGVASGNFILVLVAGFVVLVGQLELAMLKRIEEARQRAREEIDDLPLVEEVEEAEPVVPVAPPEPNFSGYTWDPRLSAWVEWRNGWPVRKCRMRAW